MRLEVGHVVGGNDVFKGTAGTVWSLGQASQHHVGVESDRRRHQRQRNAGPQQIGEQRPNAGAKRHTLGQLSRHVVEQH